MNQKNGIKRKQIEIYTYMIGMCTVLFLGNMLNLNGIAYLTVAFYVVFIVWELMGSKVTDIFSRMVRSRYSKGQYINAALIYRYVISAQALLGAFCSILLAMCARPIAVHLFHMSYATFIIVIFAPTLFLRSVSSVILGEFQGHGSDFPAVLVNVIRQILFLILAFAGANLLFGYGEKVSKLLEQDAFRVMYGGMGVAGAMVITELVILILLLFLRHSERKSRRTLDTAGLKATDSMGNALRIFYGNLFMDSIVQVLVWFPLCTGCVLFLRNEYDARTLSIHFGVFAGKYLPLIGFATLPVCAALLGATARGVSSLKRDEQRLAKTYFQNGLHMSVIHGLFLAVFFIVMAVPLAGVFCASQPQLLVNLLRVGGVMVLLLSVCYFFIKILLYIGKKLLLVIMLMLLNIVYCFGVVLFMRGEPPAVVSLIYAGVITGVVGCLTFGIAVFRLLRMGIAGLTILGFPVAAACVEGLLLLLLHKFVTPFLGDLSSLVLSFVLTAIVYWVILLATGNVKEQELKTFSLGQLIYKAGHMSGLV